MRRVSDPFADRIPPSMVVDEFLGMGVEAILLEMLQGSGEIEDDEETEGPGHA